MTRVVVVGGGIVGTAVAAELVEHLGAEIRLISDGGVAGGATAAAMGHLVALDADGAKGALTDLSLELWGALDLPRDCELRDGGTLWVAESSEDLAAAGAMKERFDARGVACELVGEQDLATVESELRPGLAGGLRVASDSVLYPPNAASFFWRLARAAGAELIDGRVVEVEPGIARLQNGDVIEGDVVVVAAGDRSAELVSGLPVRPKKGHLLITTRAPSPFVRHQVVELGYGKSTETRDAVSVACNVQPRPRGQVLIGSSRQEDTRDSRVELGVLSRMARRAGELLPRLHELVALRAWTGFRAATPDGAPIIGLVEPGVAVATGHEGLGITQAPATARLLRRLLGGERCEVDPSPFDPQRFREASL